MEGLGLEIASMTADYVIQEASELGLSVPAATEFIKREWERPIVLSEPRYYEWQFKEPPAAGGRDPCVVTLSPKGTIVGFMGLVVRHFRLGDVRYKVAEPTTWVIAKEERGKGLGRRLLEFLQLRYQLLITQGPSSMSPPLFLRAGFKLVHRWPRFLRVLDEQLVSDIGEISPLGRRLFEVPTLHASIFYNAHQIRFEDIALSNSNSRHFNSFERVPEELKWRYVDHPILSYEVTRVASELGIVYVIHRINDFPGFRVIHVMDVLGDEAAVPAAVSFLDQLGLDVGASLLEFYCATPRITRHFWSQGWLSNSDDTFVRVPHLFHPVSLSEPCTPPLILWSRQKMSDLLDLGNLYLTRADTDLDRPPKAYLDRYGWKEEKSSDHAGLET